MTNHQRIGAISNSQVGKDFERVAKAYLEQVLNSKLVVSFPVELKSFDLGKSKVHRFDLGNDTVIVECKSHRWTSGLNIPSAKLTVWNEAMLFFSLAPIDILKILFVESHLSSKHGKTLAEYYFQAHGHLIPRNVEIWEFDSIANIHRVYK